ncbi:TlpA family protein disulfide reductase [Algoriphagus yeomjeoni]|uniref:AhpC/TSA family protein n=1 Tax=Algoriphagus yeomjeoni TaxID=291403 RepID=A0A327PKU4_9BACT|nr:redoxin domain-containing protein [Algoriphagus yeomjeoni]RAI92011.1 AhpC/TSA family protein [Algoriphagus yeomjeoni]
MIKKRLFISCLFIALISCSKESSLVQDQNVTVTKVSTTVRHSLDDKLFNAKTGEPISMEEFSKMIKENPTIGLDKIYDKYGNPEKFLYNPDEPSKNYSRRDPSLQPQIGQKFPDFTFTTIANKEISSEEMLGKWVIVRFDFFADKMDIDNYVSFSEEINKVSKSANLTTVLCSLDTKENIDRELSMFSDVIHLVGDGQGFFAKYHITRMPTTILIDPSQNVVSYLDKDSYSEIQSLIHP